MNMLSALALGIHVALAGTFNGLIAYAIQTKVPSSTLNSLQLIFLIEGYLPMGFGMSFVWLYPPTSEHVKTFFTAEEKDSVEGYLWSVGWIVC
jgi:hypothetical protein